MGGLGAWTGILVLSACAVTRAETVNDVVYLVRTAMENRQSDSRIVGALHRMKLTESLDERTIEELESAGAGPKTLAELRRLRQVSSALPKPAASPSSARPPEPPADEQRRIVERARENALNYSRSLPDFICTQSAAITTRGANCSIP